MTDHWGLDKGSPLKPHELGKTTILTDAPRTADMYARIDIEAAWCVCLDCRNARAALDHGLASILRSHLQVFGIDPLKPSEVLELGGSSGGGRIYEFCYSLFGMFDPALSGNRPPVDRTDPITIEGDMSLVVQIGNVLGHREFGDEMSMLATVLVGGIPWRIADPEPE